MAKRVQILPSLIAERIAAGEVIERPASVVKELVENAIDARASSVEVRLLQGGTDLIEVIDNGHGMEREDLELSVCRHATSKISAFEDLATLGTLGFRGEALPSIGSVSDLTITSRSQNAKETFEIKASQTAPVKAEARQVANLNFLGDDHGTRVQVASLFSQVPARLKFLKSRSAEASAVREIIERLALTHPEVRFKLQSEGRTLLDLPSETLKNRAIRMLSNDNPYQVQEVELPGSYGVQIIWLKGLSFPHARSMYQIVNGRALRDRTLQMAILNPLKQSFLPGNFPAIVVKLNVPADEIDVNVHPTKTEIRFLDSRKIFVLCDAAFQKILGPLQEQQPYSPTYRASSYSSYASATSSGGYTAPSFQFTPASSGNASMGTSPGDEVSVAAPYSPGYTPFLSFENPSSVSVPSFIDSTPLGEFRGVLFSTYFVYERGNELTLIDQHAAHERIRYEKLKKSILNRERMETQTLLVPEAVKLPIDKMESLKPRLEFLTTLGFEAELFGEDALLFRAVPAVWGNQNLSSRLKNLIERLSETDVEPAGLAWDETLFEKIAMEACRSSFKAGDYMDSTAAADLVRKLYHCEHPGNCPHGRPTSITISQNKVEEWFNRLS